MRSKYRLGVDAGGTFTDFVLADDEGQICLQKVLSSPNDPTKAIQEGLELLSEEVSASPAEIVRQTDLCINGTTVCLNALIEHKGSKVGLICTKGHEDSIEIRLGHKEDGHRYDAEYPAAHMLVPRYLRFPVEERILSDGSIKYPLIEEDVRKSVTLLIDSGVEAVAISFLWSVLNNQHEQRAAEIVREMMPDVFLCLGSEIYPQTREYTRTSTTVVNAYLGPIMKNYVAAIDRYFNELGALYPVRYFQSNGGLAIGEAMTDRSVYAINSGPASAPQAGQYVSKPFGLENIITVDMGGTSFDITLTRSGQTNLNKNIDFLRYRIGVPMIQVETLGAGGGSIAWIDELGLLQVGPKSAGSDPGPACYGLGGKEPTVTDANMVLGYLNPDSLLDGRMQLNRDKSFEVIETAIAIPLGISVERAAYGIFTIVNNNMVNGIRRVSVERGYDPRDFVLVAAGGAASAHVTALAREMGIKKILVPKLAPGLCAFGQIISDAKYNYMATSPLRLDPDSDPSMLNGLFEKIEKEGQGNLLADGFSKEDIRIQRSIDMRYVGQVHECTVDIDNVIINKNSIAGIIQSFHERHKQLFTYSEPNSVVEIVNIESTIYGIISKPGTKDIVKGDGNVEDAILAERQMIFDADGKYTDAKVFNGTALKGGDSLTGPAVIQEPATTIVLEPGWKALLHQQGSYVLESV